MFKTQSRFFVSHKRLMFAALRDLIAEAIETRVLKSDMSPEQITELLFATAGGLIYSWCLHHGEFALEEKMRRCMGFQVHALFTPSLQKPD